MITVYLPTSEVTKSRPTEWSLTPTDGWATMQITQAQLQEWKGASSIPEASNNQRQLLHG